MSRAAKKPRPTPVTGDELWEQWRADIERIFQENAAAFRNRYIFRQVMEIVERNERLRADGGYFLRWLARCYGRDQALAVRREVDDSNDAINLVQLMKQMTRRPEVMSRERYRAHFSPNSIFTDEMKDHMFTNLAGDVDHISRAVISEDRKTLINACDPVATYVSKLIAHRTPVEQLDLTIPQVDVALDAIEAVFQKYMVLLTGRDIVALEPAVQFDWEDIFTYPWIQRSADTD